MIVELRSILSVSFLLASNKGGNVYVYHWLGLITREVDNPWFKVDTTPNPRSAFIRLNKLGFSL